MVTLRSILCPVDFSDHSRHALRLADALATRVGGRLVVLNVVDPLLADAARLRLGLELARDEVAPALAAFVHETCHGGHAPGLEPTISVRVGDPPEVIVSTASHDAASVIVMGTHGLGGLRKWLLGSTTERVLRRTLVPVLAVPPGRPAGHDGADALFSGGPVLAVTDFCEPAATAIEAASALAQHLAVPLLIAHAVEPLMVAPQWRAYVDGAEETRLADARVRLARVADRCAGPHVPEIIVSPGRAADVIAAIAEERRAGLIVMGLTGAHAADGRRPGSIAYQVLCLADVPVLIVPAADGR